MHSLHFLYHEVNEMSSNLFTVLFNEILTLIDYILSNYSVDSLLQIELAQFIVTIIRF